MAKQKTAKQRAAKAKTVAKKTAAAPKPKAAPAPKSAPKPKPAPSPKAPPAPAGPVLQRLRSVIYQVGDVTRAKAFYGALLGREPYFDEPYYVGYDVAGQELGLDPDVSRIAPGPGGAIGFWVVADVHASWEHALSHGGEPVEPPHNVGEGMDIAIVQDPFGNYIGLIQTTR